MRTRARARLPIALALAAACGGPRLDGRVYRGDGFAMHLGEVPTSWRRVDVTDAALAFRDDSGGATIAIDGRCDRDGDDVPLAALTQHLFLQLTEREIVSQEVSPFDGREILHTVLVAKLDGVTKKFDVWVLKKDGCVYDLYFIAQPEGWDAKVAPFRAFVAGFHVTRAESP
jgi:hypothetical protein